MASIRLTVTLRAKIHDRLIHDRFDERKKAIKEQRHQLAMAAYRHIVGKDAAKLDELPEGWVPAVSQLQVQIAGEYVRLSLPPETRVRVPYSKSTGWCMAVFEARTPIAKEYARIRSADAALKADIDQVSAEINAVLGAASTTARLIEDWPEISELVEKICEAPVRNLPTINIDRLNKKLGISEPAKAVASGA